MAALAKELIEHGAAEKADVLNRFWKEVEGNCPLIEPMAADKNFSWVTFLWHGDDNTRSVQLIGGPASTDGDSMKWFTHLAGSNVWYRTVLVPSDARCMYWFSVNRPEILPADSKTREQALTEARRMDPLNRHTISFGQATPELELPDAPPQPWLKKNPAVPEGKLSDEQTIDSKILNQKRRFAVYTSPDDDAEKNKRWLLIMFDAGLCLPNYPIVFDNLRAEKKIPPLTAVFIYQTEERDKELACSQPFANFVANELVPWVRSNYQAPSEGKRTIIGGISRSGLMAAYCGLKHPETFGNVLSMSGSYWWYPEYDDEKSRMKGESGWLTRQYVASRALPIRFFISAGRFEIGYPINLLTENRRFRDVLLSDGYTVDYREYSGGHDPGNWNTALVDGLTALSH